MVNPATNTDVNAELANIFNSSAKSEIINSTSNLQVGSLPENTTLTGATALDVLKLIFKLEY